MFTEPQRGLRRSAPQPGPRLLGVPVPPRALGFGAGWHTWSAAPLGPTRSVGGIEPGEHVELDDPVERPRSRSADAGRVRLGLARAAVQPPGSLGSTLARTAA
jgi:hypothetical protein